MDSELIYVKTTSGEEAMHQRTRVVQRNVRMVLILVDGHSTVADLCLKTGNQKLTENALLDLEKGGFIQVKVEQDSLWDESKKVAQEFKAAAINLITSADAKEASGTSVPASQENRVFVHSVFPVPTQNDSSISQFSLAPMPSVSIPVEPSTPVIAEDNLKESKKRAKKNKQPGLSVVDRIKALFPGTKQNDEDTVSLKPIRRGHRDSMGWPAFLISGLAGVLALAFLAVNFFPYDSFIPEVEAAFAQATGRPVKLGAMSINLYPKPGLILTGVRIGTGKDELRIAGIRLQPAIGSLMAAKIIFRDVVLDGATLPAELIAGLPAVFVSMMKPTARAGFEHISFEQAEVSFSGLGFSGMEGEVRISAAGVFQSLLMHSPERSLKLELKPVAQGLDVSLDALGWSPSLNSLYLFDSASVQGRLEGGAFTISKMELRIFDGLLNGVAILRADKKPSVTGELVFERVNAARFGAALGLGQQFSGEATGKILYSSTSDSWATIFSAIEADGEFTMRRGAIRGIDLTEAVRRGSGTPVQGGETRFEQLSGRIRLMPTGYQFPGLILNSGLMQSTGTVEVSKDLKLSGKMELQMHGSVNQTRVPISISGSLKTPAVQSGRL
jgi:hypothetical protein